MILFTILAIIAIILIVFTVIAVSVGGAVTIIVFGDVIVCVAMIAGIMAYIIKKRRDRD